MTIDRKVILLGRHGVAPQKPEGGSADSIEDASIQRMYSDSKDILCTTLDDNASPSSKAWEIVRAVPLKDIKLRHTAKVRTKITGLTRLAGALRVGPMPKNADEALNYAGLQSIGTEIDDNLDFNGDELNMAVYKRDTSRGNLDYWLQNPTAVIHEGIKIAPWATHIGQKGVLAAQSAVKDALNGKKVVFTIAHATTIDPAVIALIESSGKKVRSCDDFGGAFDMEGYGLLLLDVNAKSGSTEAVFLRSAKAYPVDVQALLNKAPEVKPYK